MTRAWLKAYRGAPAIAGTVLLCLAGLLTTRQVLYLATATPLRSIWLMLLGVAVCSSLPLYPAFGPLEGTWARVRLNRLLRAGEAAALAATAALVLGGLHETQPVVIWFVLLAAISLLACVATADSSWAIVLAAGTGSIMVDHVLEGVPVSRAMQALGLRPALCAYIVAWLTFVLIPRRSTSS